MLLISVQHALPVPAVFRMRVKWGKIGENTVCCGRCWIGRPAVDGLMLGGQVLYWLTNTRGEVMAAKIRLKKVGRRGQPSYRVVVLDGRKPRDAKVVADLGHYDPKTDPATFEVNNELAIKWLLDGAKATKAARDILSQAGVMKAWDEAKRQQVQQN
jgi:small subunit ribosomal protein S16